jgi:hypothetical protein
MTVLDHIVQSLRLATHFNKHDVAAPSVILWTDGDRHWESVASRVGESLDRFYILGEDGDTPGRGPSTWIRYQLTAESDKEGIPVIYLPGLPRHAFRSAVNFPDEARHLYALQFQGQFWTQLNAKDWTPGALLGSGNGGLGLDLAQDQATIKALAMQLEAVLDTSVTKLTGKRLESADFNGLAMGDPVGTMLRWLSDPVSAESTWTPEQRSAFQGICRDEFDFDLRGEGRIGAAEKLVEGGGAWDKVWARYEEGPTNYRGMREALGLVKAVDLFQNANPRLPENNKTAENALRTALTALSGKAEFPATQAIIKLEKEHRPRAGSVWAQLGDAPLAEAISHLGAMITAIKEGFPGSAWDELAEHYLKAAWKVDAEARLAFAAVRNHDDIVAVTAALQAVYLPWLAKQADRLGPIISTYPNPEPKTARGLKVDPGTVYLFVDGLRADLASELCRLLGYSGLHPSVTSDWSALPTVTATSKPAWEPLTTQLCGEKLPEGFGPQLASDHSDLNTAKFRKELVGLGITYFESATTADPSGTGWTEAADFDSRGHKDGAKLAWRIKEELQVVRHRVTELLQVGWKKVVIVTDHGWLWMPGGLPKTDLPKHLTASKWGRCAVAKEGVQHSLPTAPWFWGSEHHVVLAPGVTALWNGVEYAHGGLTIQEALTVSITVTNDSTSGLADVSIVSVRWLGLRLQAEFEGATPDLFVDVRAKAADPSTSFFDPKEPRPIRPDGKISTLIGDESHEGKSATLVVLHQGEVICKEAVTVGEN